MSPEDEYIAASIDFIKQYHKEGYDLIADTIIEEGLAELEQPVTICNRLNW